MQLAWFLGKLMDILKQMEEIPKENLDCDS